MRPPKVIRELASVDRDLMNLRGLEALPGWEKKVNALLDTRLLLMRGFTVKNLRRSPTDSPS